MRHVVILPDNDDEGRKHGEQIAQNLRAEALTIKILSLPGLPPKGDVVEWFQQGGTAEELRRMAAACAEWQPSEIDFPTQEAPLPLVRDIQQGEKFPVEALSGLLGGAAQSIQKATQTAFPLCGSAVLAAAALACQPHRDIVIDGRIYPLSLYLLSIARSGDRKSTVDNLVLNEHQAVQQERFVKYAEEKKTYKKDLEAYKAACREALTKSGGCKGKKHALEDMGDEPEEPLCPQILMDEPSIEGLVRQFNSVPSLGLFTDEGGVFVGGYAMSQEHRTRTVSVLSQLWNGRPITRVRGMDGASVLYGRRLSLHLMAQPRIASLLTGDKDLEDQGILSRFLICYPPSMAGKRPYKSVNAFEDRRLQAYFRRVRELLEEPLPFNEDGNGVDPQRVTLTAEAFDVFRNFHDAVDVQIADGGILAPIYATGAKAAEQAVRLAGVLTLFENPGAKEIGEPEMEAGAILSRFYLNEALRLHGHGEADAEMEAAQGLLNWLHRREDNKVSLAEITQYGPIRDTKAVKRIMQILEEFNWAIHLEGGLDYNGCHRRDAWKVVKK